MTREEEYRSTILIIYETVKNFIKMSKRRGLGKEQLVLLVDSFIELFDIIMIYALRDDFIKYDNYDVLLDYVGKLSYYLKECIE